jgi:hypothetical protein
MDLAKKSKSSLCLSHSSLLIPAAPFHDSQSCHQQREKIGASLALHVTKYHSNKIRVPKQKSQFNKSNF